MIGAVKYRNDGATNAHWGREVANVGDDRAKGFLARQSLPFAGFRKGNQVSPFEIHEHGVPPKVLPAAQCGHDNLNISQPQRTFFAIAENFREAQHA